MGDELPGLFWLSLLFTPKSGGKPRAVQIAASHDVGRVVRLGYLAGFSWVITPWSNPPMLPPDHVPA